MPATRPPPPPFTSNAAWCCGGANGWNEQGIFRYQQPRPLEQGWAEWRFEGVPRPAWCEHLIDENKPHAARYENHICNFTSTAQ